MRPLRPIIYDACFYFTINARTISESMLNVICVVFIKASEIVRFKSVENILRHENSRHIGDQWFNIENKYLRTRKHGRNIWSDHDTQKLAHKTNPLPNVDLMLVHRLRES